MLHGGFHGGVDFESFVSGLVVVFGGGACGGFCRVAFRWGLMVVFVVVNGSFGDGGGRGVNFCGSVCG